VLSRQFKISKSENNTPVDMLQKLRDQYPKCCSFLFKMKDAPAFVGCSPEQLLSFQQNALRTEALAGSIARGKDEEEDARFKNALLGSSKNNAEHQFVVQSIEQDLAPFVKNMQRSEQPIIKKLANVQHLYTPVQAQMIGDKNPLTILGQLHPTPAVGGYPRKIAVDYIKNNESLNRGWFASPVGWINSEGAGDFTVAIRSGLIDKTNALLFAGCGIVADSNPETEWQETNLKFMPMLSALNHD
jgi:menaquinone-specific isochorismate synthase